MFHGTHEEGYQLAMQDADQYEIESILAFRGDPFTRTTMEFYVSFVDGTKRWLTWTEDLFLSVPYEKYCASIPSLFPLIHRVHESRRIILELNKTPITTVSPGDICYVDLRYYGATWYASLNLPDGDFKTYVVLYQYKKWIKGNLKIEVFCKLFNEIFIVDHLFVKQYGSEKEFKPGSMTLIDKNFIQKYPQVLPNK